MPEEAYEHVITGHLSGQFVQTVLHSVIDNTTSLNPYAVAENLNNLFIAPAELLDAFLDALPTNYVGSSIRTRRVGPTGGPVAIALASTWNVSTGQRTGDIQSQQVNPLLILIPVDAPAKTGRIFMPGASEDDIDEGQIQAGLVSAMEALGAYLDAGWTVAGGTGKGGVYRRATKTVDPLGYYRVSPLIGTQRRRLKPI